MKFSQMTQRIGNRFKQRLVPFVNGVYGIYAKLRIAVGRSIVIDDASDEPLTSLRVFGKSTQNGTPTPTSPVEIVGVENPIVAVCGKNLLNITTKTETVSGVTFTISENGTVTVNGTASDDIYFDLATGVEALRPNTSYHLSGCPSNGADATYLLRVSDKITQAYDDYGEGHIFSYSNVSKLTVSIRIRGGVTVKNIVFSPMICLAPITNKSFENYKKSQLLTASNTLHGIPVESGGNYTDENGQQWICDEVDFERGLYVQRIGHIKSYNGEAINSPYLSTTGSLTTGATVLYQLPTPIETPLTADQLEAYKSLRTNKPTTTITNDKNAWMEVGYIKN